MTRENPNDIKEFNIREMIRDDVEGIYRIEKLCFSSPWSKESLLYEFEKNALAKYWVAEKDGQVIGYMGVWLIEGEGNITNIAIDPSYQGLGVANKLMTKFMDVLDQSNINSITLEVRQSNLIAQNLYKKFGFKEAGIRKKYYNNNEDALIMWKNK
ncbi:MAG: ribosomal protein S18-alanine N-acetyltransferase [Peptostreptococcales bacterium]